MSSPVKKRKNSHIKGIFREIFVSASRELSPFGMVFVYSPENFEQKQLGTVFGIIKISDTSPDSSFIANLLASVIKKEYFSKPSRTAFDSLEASLKKANFALAELARQGSVKWIGKLSFAGGALEKNNLHFSKLGDSSILLLRGGALADIGFGLGDEAAESDSHPLKTFSDISSGKVEAGDCLILTTSDLLEIFSFEEIRQNAARFSREEFPDILSASLKSNSELSGTIVVNIVREEESLPEIEKVPPAHADRYPHRETPRKADIARVNSPISILPSPPQPAKKEKSLYISESDDIIPKKSFGEKFSSIAKSISSLSRNGFFAIKKHTNVLFGRIKWQKMTFMARSVFSIVRQKINVQKKNSRIFMITGAIVVLALIYFSLSKIIGGRNTGSNQAGTNSTPQQNTQTSPVLRDANVKNIETISEIASLPADSRELLFLGDSLFALNSEKSVLKIDPSSGETENADSNIASGKFTLAAAMPDLGAIFILTDDKKIVSFMPANKRFQENNISLPDNLNATDMKAYLTYIYIFDSNASQIYRYPRAEGGFGEAQNWLKNGQDLKGADKFAINDDIFAANNLNIIPLLQGKIDSTIDFQKPETPLRIDAIFTAPGLENIYALDNKNHRIVQFSKDGKIANQYFNSSITKIQDFTVDEKNKTIYLEKSDSLSKFSME